MYYIYCYTNKLNNHKYVLTTSLSNRQIGEMIGASEETVRRIKVGQVFRDDKLSYPLSNL